MMIIRLLISMLPLVVFLSGCQFIASSDDKPLQSDEVFEPNRFKITKLQQGTPDAAESTTTKKPAVIGRQPGSLNKGDNG